MLDIVWWLLVIACFVAAFAALVFPIIPGVPLLWAGALIYYFGINSGELGWFFWTALVIVSLIILISDFVANKLFLQKAESTKWSERLGPLAVIVGAFFIPPFGLILVPFAVVFVTEILHKKPYHEAFRLAGITVVSFITSTTVKLLLQMGIVLLFVLSIVF